MAHMRKREKLVNDFFGSCPKGDRLWLLAYVAQFKNSWFNYSAEVVYSLGINFDYASVSDFQGSSP